MVGEWLASWVPPWHPILVNFTAALIPASVLSDWLGRVLKKESLTGAGWWMMLYAGIITPFTAVAGWWWMEEMKAGDGKFGWQIEYHQWLGYLLAGVTVGLALWRGWERRKKNEASWGYLITATVVLAALIVQADLGGQMSFGE